MDSDLYSNLFTNFHNKPNKEERVEYAKIIEKAYRNQLNREVDEEGFNDSYCRICSGTRTEEELYYILATSEESKLNIRNELKKYGRESETDTFAHKLGERKISSFRELCEEIRISSRAY